MAKRGDISEGQIIDAIQRVGLRGAARELDCNLRSLAKRRRRIEQKLGRPIVGPYAAYNQSMPPSNRITDTIADGVVIIFSDAHYWPGQITTAHLALVKFIKELKPKIIVNCGDSIDGAIISSYAPKGFENLPTVQGEITANQERLSEVSKAAPKAKRIYCLGNHDQRFESRLASHAPEFARVQGTRLEDHLPDWEFCISLWLNDEVVIKHRWKGGSGATRSNALHAGKTMITGHLHSQQATPHTDLNGTRWGVDVGCLAEPFGPQFRYAEDNPRDWRSGFAALTFSKGRLLDPELVRVIEPGVVNFRGKLHKIGR